MSAAAAPLNQGKHRSRDDKSSRASFATTNNKRRFLQVSGHELDRASNIAGLMSQSLEHQSEEVGGHAIRNPINAYDK